MWRIRNVRRLGDSKGANLVEAAIITPLLLLLTLAIVDFASMFYGYLALEHGVSQATRFAITGQTLSGPRGAMDRQESIKYGDAAIHADPHDSRQRLQLQLHALDAPAPGRPASAVPATSGGSPSTTTGSS